MNIEQQIRRYIYKETDRLRHKGDSVKLQCVYPDVIEYVLGCSEEPYELNGYDCDYWMIIGNYKIHGSMRFGTATVTLTEDK